MNRILPAGVVGVFCWCATLAHAQDTAQEKALAALKAGGAQVYFDEKQPAKPVFSISFAYPKKATDALLEHVKAFPELLALYIDDESLVTDKGLQHLKGLTKLQTLTIRGAPDVTDKGLEYLA